MRQREKVQELPRQIGLTTLDKDDIRRAPRLLHTPRLTLEAPRIEHAQAFADSLNASLAGWSFVGFAQLPGDLAWAQRFCLRGVQYIDDGESLIFNAFENASGACVGRIDVHSFDFEVPRGEVGYVGDVRLAGRGLMREAVLAVVELGFAIGLTRIEAISDARNVRAVHFALGLGFTREGLLRQHERDPQGRLCDMVVLSRLHTDPPPAATRV